MKFSIGLATAGALFMTYGSALAAEPPAAGESVPARFQRLLDCRQIQDGAQRLACYDAQVADVAAAQQNRDLVVVDREQIRSTRRSLFGLSLPSLAIFGRGHDGAPEEEEVSQIDSTLSRVSIAADSRWRFTIADGARWLQIDSRPLGREPRAGMPVRIRKAALGSYFAMIDGQNGIRVRREN